jgi:hypothetical protein
MGRQTGDDMLMCVCMCVCVCGARRSRCPAVCDVSCVALQTTAARMYARGHADTKRLWYSWYVCGSVWGRAVVGGCCVLFGPHGHTLLEDDMPHVYSGSLIPCNTDWLRGVWQWPACGCPVVHGMCAAAVAVWRPRSPPRPIHAGVVDVYI